MTRIARKWNLRLRVALLLFAAAVILPCSARAATAALAVGKVAGLAGTSVDVPVSFTAGTSAVSSVQCDLTYPSSRVTYVSSAIGDAAGAAGKDAIVAATSTGARLIVFGLNQNAVGTGTVATVRLLITAGFAAGTVTIGITTIAGAGPDGLATSVTGASGSIAVSLPPDTTPPVISGVASSGITQSAAKVAWTTDETSDTQVEYGTTTDYGKTTTLSTSKVKTHSQNLASLTPNTEYHYRVKSKDAAGNLAISGDFTFATAFADVVPPVISGVAASGITQSAATITWTTDELSDTEVEYGSTAAYGKKTIASTKVTAHSKTLTALTPSTLYHYRVLSKDAAGNVAVSGDFTLTTTAPDKTPPVISAVAASGMTQTAATITWTTDEPSDTQIEYGPTTAYGRSTTSSTRVTAHAKTLTGLTNSTLYHYRVKSKDAAANLAVSGDFIFTTLAPD